MLILDFLIGFNVVVFISYANRINYEIIWWMRIQYKWARKICNRACEKLNVERMWACETVKSTCKLVLVMLLCKHENAWQRQF